MRLSNGLSLLKEIVPMTELLELRKESMVKGIQKKTKSIPLGMLFGVRVSLLLTYKKSKLIKGEDDFIYKPIEKKFKNILETKIGHKTALKRRRLTGLTKSQRPAASPLSQPLI